MPPEVKKYVKREKTPEQATASLMRLCARAEKSSGDALRLMRGWGIAAGDQQKILGKLLDQRFIDDRRYAAAYVREKVRLSGWGGYKISAALSAKGVSKEIIKEALEEFGDRDVMNDRLSERLAAKMKKTTGTPYEIKGKLMRYGLSLGFDYESVTSAVERLIKE